MYLVSRKWRGTIHTEPMRVFKTFEAACVYANDLCTQDRDEVNVPGMNHWTTRESKSKWIKMWEVTDHSPAKPISSKKWFKEEEE